MSKFNPKSLMQRLVRISLALAIGLGLMVGIIWLLAKTVGNHSNLYQGKLLNYWIEQLNSPDTGASNRAYAVLNQDILPHLAKVMFHDTNDSSLRVALVDKLNGLPGVCVYFTPADGRRADAARSIGELGPSAQPAIPLLIQALKGHDEAVRGPAAGALGKIHGQPDVVIPLLISYLDDNNLNDEAAEALGDFGPLAKSALPKLIPLLKAPDKDLHHAVVDALKKIDPSIKP